MMSYITWKPARLVIWIILSAFIFKQVLFPLIISFSFYLWTLIKHNKFIYIILINFIIISILISSTSLTPFFNNLFLKLYKSFSHSSLPYHHDDHQSSSSPPDDDHHDDVWWFLSLSQMDHELGPQSTTASFGVQEVDKHHNKSDEINVEDNLDVKDEDTWWFFSLPEMDHKTRDEEKKESSTIPVLKEEDEHHNKVENNTVEEKSVVGEEGEGEEEDSLDETWKAIMESKGKESGPQLKKSDTWSAGDDQKRKERGGVMGGLSKYKVTVQLKKWQSFRDMIERREYFGGGGGGEGCGDKRGWKSVDIALTFQDELKKKADAFIARFKLQRLESDQRFMDMINRGH